MEQDKKLSGEDSLKIIQEMIHAAKSNFSDNGFGWLLWGSMIFLASMATFIFIEVGYHNLFLGWNIFGVITIILLTYELVMPRKVKVRTYLDDILRLVDVGFIISLFVIIISINVAVTPNAGFGYFLMIYASLMLIQGGALRFKPLMIGAVVNYLGAVAIFINKDFKYDMLITAVAVFIGYIIPGLILRAQYKRQHIQDNPRN